MALSRSVREVLREDGVLSGPDITVPTVTPSGQTTSISLSNGDQIRFLSRDDHLGVINGTMDRIAAVHQRGGEDPLDIEVEANVEGRTVNFLLSEIADSEGRARLAWAYASTIYQAQGTTVERAVVLVDGNFDRHQIFVVSSRARQQTTLVLDAQAIDRQLAGELPVGQPQKDNAFEPEARRAWLGPAPLAGQHQGIGAGGPVGDWWRCQQGQAARKENREAGRTTRARGCQVKGGVP